MGTKRRGRPRRESPPKREPAAKKKVGQSETVSFRLPQNALIDSGESSEDEFFSLPDSPPPDIARPVAVPGAKPLKVFPPSPQIYMRDATPVPLGDTDPPFGGVLSGSDADVALGIPTATERHLFTRFSNNPEPMATEYDPERTQNVSRMTEIHIGGRSVRTWYSAPYPEEYAKRSSISLCDMCLKYMKSDFVAYRHMLKCHSRAPPGTEIYRDGDCSVFEVDGARAPIYCQQLCLLAKLFLDSKALYYDVQPFLFYVLTVVDKSGCHFVGYFSKLKTSSSFRARQGGNNVSCIVTLPGLQRKGYGQFLIALSYELTKLQETTGTPEKPLSDLGAKTYTKFWILHLCRELEKIKLEKTKKVSIRDLSGRTGMTPDDVIYSLETLDWLHGDRISVSGPELKQRLHAWRAKDPLIVKPERLFWVPLMPLAQNGDL